MTSGQADSTADDFNERVLRNEGELNGLKTLVSETREADRKLIEQRSDSLADELQTRAAGVLDLLTARSDAVLALGKEERRSDREHLETLTAEAEKRGQLALTLLREVYDTAIKQNYEQSREAIDALESRRDAATDKLEQMVRQWRDSDDKADQLFTKQLDRHLDALNHNNERMREFQATSVTRELWQSEKDASIKREGLLRDQIIAIDLTLLKLNTIEQADKTHAEMTKTMEANIASASRVLDNKIGVLEDKLATEKLAVSDKLAELNSYRYTASGRSAGYSALYGWAVAAVGLILTAIVLVNAFLTK